MSAYPSYTMGGLCVAGGIMGFARRGSVMSLVAGLGVGSLYLYSAYRIRELSSYGLEGAAAASTILLLSSLPRVTKGPVPLMLAVSSLVTGAYYGRVIYQIHQYGSGPASS
ncbi:hypothetical protein FISHEDRAFT_78848 [Fistulina hepatica ATCC 64428]|uniref:TMEM14-domain-containing protein n=1 Tax=Fistulina hepatica ATCC 64428 TaxID=1128425 RepID=A0A0D7A004_9AGAR|nr:hypothetical protein FISHEDRAFT_78848 [Fistulina hepatica ATCC 64428]